MTSSPLLLTDMIVAIETAISWHVKDVFTVRDEDVTFYHRKSPGISSLPNIINSILARLSWEAIL